MDIELIIIVGDRTVTEDDDVEWENVQKDNIRLPCLQIGKDSMTPRDNFRVMDSAINEVKWQVLRSLEVATARYLNKLTKSMKGG
jgi:hypothetical protein